MSRFRVGQKVQYNKSEWSGFNKKYPRGSRGTVTSVYSGHYEPAFNIKWDSPGKDWSSDGWLESTFRPYIPEDPFIDTDY